jgi:hypothetical protein
MSATGIKTLSGSLGAPLYAAAGHEEVDIVLGFQQAGLGAGVELQ